jgi:hypothetical protein
LVLCWQTNSKYYKMEKMVSLMILSLLRECFQIQVHHHIFTQETPHGSNISHYVFHTNYAILKYGEFLNLLLQLKYIYVQEKIRFLGILYFSK